MSSEHPDHSVFNSAREELRNQIEWRKIQKKLVAGSEPYGSAPVRDLMEATQFCCFNKQHLTGINLDVLLSDIIRRFADKSSMRINRKSVESVVAKKRSEFLAKCNPKLLTNQISPRYLGKKIFSDEIIWVTVIEWLKDSLESDKPIDEFIKELHKMFLDILDALMAAEVITLDDDDTPTGRGQSSSQTSSGQRSRNRQPNQGEVITLSDDDDEPIGARQQQDRPAAPLNPSRQPPVPKPSSQSQPGRGNGQAPKDVEVISLSDDDDEEGPHTAPISTGSSGSSRQQIQQKSVEQGAPVPSSQPPIQASRASDVNRQQPIQPQPLRQGVPKPNLFRAPIGNGPTLPSANPSSNEVGNEGPQVPRTSTSSNPATSSKRPGSSMDDHTNRNAAPSDVPSDQSIGRSAPKIARTTKRQEVTRPPTDNIRGDPIQVQPASAQQTPASVQTKSIGIQTEETRLQPPIDEVTLPVDRPVLPASAQNIQHALDQARAVDIQAVRAAVQPDAPAPVREVTPPVDPAPPQRRGRGRPRKHPLPTNTPAPVPAPAPRSEPSSTSPAAPVPSSTRRSGSSRQAAPTTRSSRSSTQLTSQQKAEIRELVANDRSLQVIGKRAATKIAERLRLGDDEARNQKIQVFLKELAKERKESAQRERMPRKAKKN